MASTKTIFAILISASAVTLLGMYLYGGETIQASIYPQSFTRSSQSEDSPISNTRFALSSRLEPMPKQKLKKASLPKPRAGSKCPFKFKIEWYFQNSNHSIVYKFVNEFVNVVQYCFIQNASSHKEN